MTVILVRHGERDPAGTDALSPKGKARAALLATMFADTGVSAIFTSEFTRTKQTAQPLATKVGIAAQQIAAAPAAAKAQILGGGPCVVVIGHSDTVPAFIELLGGPSGIEIEESVFDRMFVLTVGSGTPASLVSFRYVNP